MPAADAHQRLAELRALSTEGVAKDATALEQAKLMSLAKHTMGGFYAVPKMMGSEGGDVEGEG